MAGKEEHGAGRIRRSQRLLAAGGLLRALAASSCCIPQLYPAAPKD